MQYRTINNNWYFKLDSGVLTRNREIWRPKDSIYSYGGIIDYKTWYKLMADTDHPDEDITRFFFEQRHFVQQMPFNEISELVKLWKTGEECLDKRVFIAGINIKDKKLNFTTQLVDYR